MWQICNCPSTTCIFQSSPQTREPASSLLIGPVHRLPWRHWGVVLWGCHSNLFEGKIEWADVALGHPHPPAPFLCSSDRSHHTGDLPGRLTSQWDDQRRAFTSTISRLQSLYDKPPTTTNIPLIPPPDSVFVPLFFLSTTPPCVTTVLLLLCWSEMGCRYSNYKWNIHQ